MLKIFNTLTKRKEDFKPIDKSNIKMYSCGPTVYEQLHIGNLRAYTMADTIRRVLNYSGYNVTHVMNWTDVGHFTLTEEEKAKLSKNTETFDSDTGIDRMEKTAQKEGLDVWQVADKYIEFAHNEFRKMNFLEPQFRPRATQTIKEQIDLIQKLIDSGNAYITDSAVYFDTKSFKGYGKLCGQDLCDKRVGVRTEVNVDKNKKNPSDFRLWQLDQPDHKMQWDSPWGRGFPGWHIECSAMAISHLGYPIDIHTGGVDLIPIHHTNEIAQSEAAYGKQFVNYWYHNAFLKVDGKKMSKSLGNVYNLDTLKARGFSPYDLKYFYFTANFRTTQNFTFKALESAHSVLGKVKSYILGILEDNNLTSIQIEDILNNTNSSSIYLNQFKEAISDSFDMPKAIAVFNTVLNDKNISYNEKIYLINEIDKVLGLDIIKNVLNLMINTKAEPELEKEIERIIALRDNAKKSKNFAMADQLRDEALKLGVELIDTPEGTTWKKVSNK